MHERREYSEHEKVSVGFKAPGPFLASVHEAAKKTRGRSTSAWLRETIQVAAAKALGVDPRTLDDDYLAPMQAGSRAQQDAADVDAQVEAEVQKRLRALLGSAVAPEAMGSTPPPKRRR